MRYSLPLPSLLSGLSLPCLVTPRSPAVLEKKVPVKVEEVAACDINIDTSAAAVLHFGAGEPWWGAELAWPRGPLAVGSAPEVTPGRIPERSPAAPLPSSFFFSFYLLLPPPWYVPGAFQVKPSLWRA